MSLKLKIGMLACLAVCFGLSFGSVAKADEVPITTGCVGSCGFDTTGNGDVSSPTGFTGYTYITTAGGVDQGGAIPVGSVVGATTTNGSTLTSGIFSANAGDSLQYLFNFVTSDGSGFPDYAWVELESSTGTPVALLFTAQTEPSGSIVPAANLTVTPDPGVTLTPGAVDISAGSGSGGGPVWDELGGSSGTCWAAGCGLTGWVQSNYTVTASGDYQLLFGVSNTNDTAFDSGLAIDGVTVAGNQIPIGTVPAPEPATVVLLALGMVTVAIASRRRQWAL